MADLFVINKTVYCGDNPAQRSYRGVVRRYKSFVKIEYNTDARLRMNRKEDGTSSNMNELSMCGTIGRFQGGQCTDSIRENDRFPKKNGCLTRAQVHKLCDIWDKYHLNAMNAGCVHQDTLDTKRKITVYKYGMSDAMWKDEQNLERGYVAGLENHVSKYDSDAVVGKRYKALIDKLMWANQLIMECIDSPEKLSLHSRYKELLDSGYVVLKGTEKKSAGWVEAEKHSEGLLGIKCPECGYKYGHGWTRREVPQDVLDWLSALPEWTGKEYEF